MAGDLERRPRVKMKPPISNSFPEEPSFATNLRVIIKSRCPVTFVHLILQSLILSAIQLQQPIRVCDSLQIPSKSRQDPHPTPIDGLPQFELSQPNRVVASRWQNEVYLPCKIINLDEEQTISWIRKRDSLVLTIDRLKLIDDPRFAVAHSDQDWTLVLSQPNDQDAGTYECQVSSMDPKLSRLVELRMVEATSFISSTNFSSLFLRPGDQVNVTCTIDAPHQTDFVYWYKNKEPILYDKLTNPESPKARTDRARTSADWSYKPAAEVNGRPDSVLSSSTLSLKQVRLNDTANYTCLPSNAKPSHINVIVIENGAQTQPEKRSLQASDGSNSIGFGMVGERKLLANLLKLKLVEILFPWLSHQEPTSQPLSSILLRLLFGQEFRLLFVGSVVGLLTARQL